MTDSRDPEVLAIKDQFNRLLEKLPAPVLTEEGAPNSRKNPAAKDKAAKKASARPRDRKPKNDPAEAAGKTRAGVF